MNKHVPAVQKMQNVWAIILIIWCIYRTKFYLPEWIDELLIKPAVFILPVYYYISHIEKKPILSALWIKTTQIWSDSKVGLSIGAFFWLMIVFTNFIRLGNLSFLFDLTLTRIGYLLLITLVTATSEEILSCGFVVKRLYEDSSSQLQAAFLGGILFTIIHIPIVMTNYKLTGSFILVYLLTQFFISLVINLIFLDRKSLLPSIQIHALYNLALLLYI